MSIENKSARAERRANANKNKTNSAPKAGSYNPKHCLPAVRGYKFAERPPIRKVVLVLADARICFLHLCFVIRLVILAVLIPWPRRSNYTQCSCTNNHQAKSKPLTACYEFSLNTCCTKNHTESIKWYVVTGGLTCTIIVRSAVSVSFSLQSLFSIRFIVQAAAASFNGRCRDLTEKMNCMVRCLLTRVYMQHSWKTRPQIFLPN